MSNNNFAADLAAVASEFDSPHRKPRPSKRPYFRWTDEQLLQLTALRDEGKSAAEIAETLGVSSDKVVTKLAAMTARQRAGSKEPEQSTETVPEPEQVEEPPTAEPTDDEDELVAVRVPKVQVSDEALDRMIFTAFDAVVGRVDDFNKMAACWRKALSVIEQEIRKLSYIIEQHPDADVSVCQIAAIVAYDELRA